MSAPFRTRREKVEDRERAILTAAREVFIEAGFEGARVAEIGRRAGIAEGTVYLYFRTKSALMQGVLAVFWSDLTDGARAATAEASGPGQALRQLADYHLSRLIAEHPFLDLAAKLRQLSGRDQGLRQHMRDYVRVFDDICLRCRDQHMLRRDADLWVLRDLFFGTLEYAARTLMQGTGRDRQAVVDHLIDVFIQPPDGRT